MLYIVGRYIVGRAGTGVFSISEPSYFILAALLDGPLHGYGIIKKTAKLSDGRVRLAAGTLYGALDRLAEQGLVLADHQDRGGTHTPLLPPHRPWRPRPPGGGSPHGTGSTRRHPAVRVGCHDPEAGMSGQLRRRYQRLLFAYPTDYRAAHGEEILGTLLEAARPTQRWPSWRESTSLLLGPAAAGPEAAKESPTRLWTDGLHLGVLLVVLVNLGHALQMQFPLWIALVAVGALAVLRGWGRPALAATAIAALAVARPLLPQVGLPWWLPGYGDWSAVGRYVWPAVVLAVLAWPGSAACGPGRGGGCCRPPRQRFR